MAKISLPEGFLSSGISAGIKEEKGKKDLGLIVAEADSILGGVYTQNKFPSAHVQYCKELTPSLNFRALVVNSGNANAATGQKGVEANFEMASQVAARLGVNPSQVFTSSTGIIGRPFPIQTIKEALPELTKSLQNDGSAFAEAILTTDTCRKSICRQFILSDKTYTITGFAKGSGMIHPDMATMLSYILTDAPIEKSQIQHLTKQIGNLSFNCISVDGDSSTNDSFFLISSNPVDRLEKEDYDTVNFELNEVAKQLAQKIAADGEGAEHLIEAVIKNGPSEADVDSVLKAILTSNLVKTAINGNDPNWGRVLMATGNGLKNSSVEGNSLISINIQNTPVFTRGEPVVFDELELSKKMKQAKVTITVDLNSGGHQKTGWGCDFSDEYVRINADYST